MLMSFTRSFRRCSCAVGNGDCFQWIYSEIRDSKTCPTLLSHARMDFFRTLGSIRWRDSGGAPPRKAVRVRNRKAFLVYMLSRCGRGGRHRHCSGSHRRTGSGAIDNARTPFLLHLLELGRVKNDRLRGGAQAVDRLVGQDERGR